MKTLPLLVGTLALSISLTACEQEKSAPLLLNKTWRLPVLEVPSGVPITVESVGSVVSDQRIDVSSRLSGYIRELPVQEGDRVRKGQLLARVDPADVEGGIRQSRAAVAAAAAAAADAKTDLDRFQNLYERESVSENELRKVRLKYDAAREARNQAEAAYQTARAQQDYSELRSPMDGTVVARPKRPGDLALPGMPILTLESGHGLVFETHVTGESAASLAQGSAVDVLLDRNPTPLRGSISRIVPSADPVTRSYLVRIALPETSGLMPGMFGRASFRIGESSAPAIPKRVLIERGGLSGVFVIDSQNIARFRWVRTGREWGDRVEASAGLRAGERLVAASEPGLRDGDRILVSGAAR